MLIDPIQFFIIIEPFKPSLKQTLLLSRDSNFATLSKRNGAANQFALLLQVAKIRANFLAI